MEKALRYEMNKIPEIHNKIYPTNAPEGKEPPYLVYILSRYQKTKTLEGLKNSVKSSYLLNILAPSYGQMKDLTKRVRLLVESFLMREIGTDGIYVSDLTIENISEVYEQELQLYRGIIDITVSYKE